MKSASTIEKTREEGSTSEQRSILTRARNKRSVDAVFLTPRNKISGLVRDVGRKSLRRRKLWMTPNIKMPGSDQNENELTPHSCQSKDGLSLSSYKKLGSPLYSPSHQFESPKENFDPQLSKALKKQRLSSLFTPSSLKLR